MCEIRDSGYLTSNSFPTASLIFKSLTQNVNPQSIKIYDVASNNAGDRALD